MNKSGRHARAFVPPTSLPPDAILFGASEPMLRLKLTIHRAATSDLPILIQGEPGTGKQTLARCIHLKSDRAHSPFVAVDCSTSSHPLLESKLFGYEKQSMAQIHSSGLGLIEPLVPGTVLLKEIDQLGYSAQKNLLWVFDGTVKARLLCTAGRDLQEEVTAGRFRADLFYRINAISVRVTPLRDRRSDIPELTRYFMESVAYSLGRQIPELSSSALKLFTKYDWPGNIEELKRVVESYIFFGFKECDIEDLLNQPAEENGIISTKLVSQAERDVLLEALRETNWNIDLAAQSLGFSNDLLVHKMRSAGLMDRKRQAENAR